MPLLRQAVAVIGNEMRVLKKYHYFPFKVWLTTVIGGSYLFYILHLVEMVMSSRSFELADFTLGFVAPLYLSLIVGLFSLPTLLGYGLIFYALVPHIKQWVLRLVLTTITLLGILITSANSGFNIFGSDYVWPLPYTLAALFSNYYYKVGYKSEALPIT